MLAQRVFAIVLDGVGIGFAPDAASFGDSGSDTLGHVAQWRAAAGVPLAVPTLASLGLGHLYASGLPGLPAAAEPAALFGRLTEVSAGKDTTAGHWEMMGLPRVVPSPTFPRGFPPAIVRRLSAACGVEWLGNAVASGTVIIARLGAEHLATGKPILYTSADSVLQIAAHTDVVPLARLYRICEAAREVCTGDYAVDRVIARPFTGTANAGFTRTEDRRDFSLPPPGQTTLDLIQAAGLEVIAVGKIADIFAGRGITRSIPLHGNRDQMEQVGALAGVAQDWRGLCFANLVDFDMLYGHRNDPGGFGRALEEFDAWLGGFLTALGPEEMLVITADHGNDPTTSSSDHSREQTPLLIYARGLAGGRLSPPPGFFHVGATVSAALAVPSQLPGHSCV